MLGNTNLISEICYNNSNPVYVDMFADENKDTSNLTIGQNVGKIDRSVEKSFDGSNKSAGEKGEKASNGVIGKAIELVEEAGEVAQRTLEEMKENLRLNGEAAKRTVEALAETLVPGSAVNSEAVESSTSDNHKPVEAPEESKETQETDSERERRTSLLGQLYEGASWVSKLADETFERTDPWDSESEPDILDTSDLALSELASKEAKQVPAGKDPALKAAAAKEPLQTAAGRGPEKKIGAVKQRSLEEVRNNLHQAGAAGTESVEGKTGVTKGSLPSQLMFTQPAPTVIKQAAPAPSAQPIHSKLVEQLKQSPLQQQQQQQPKQSAVAPIGAKSAPIVPQQSAASKVAPTKSESKQGVDQNIAPIKLESKQAGAKASPSTMAPREAKQTPTLPQEKPQSTVTETTSEVKQKADNAATRTEAELKQADAQPKSFPVLRKVGEKVSEAFNKGMEEVQRTAEWINDSAEDFVLGGDSTLPPELQREHLARREREEQKQRDKEERDKAERATKEKALVKEAVREKERAAVPSLGAGAGAGAKDGVLGKSKPADLKGPRPAVQDSAATVPDPLDITAAPEDTAPVTAAAAAKPPSAAPEEEKPLMYKVGETVGEAFNKGAEQVQKTVEWVSDKAETLVESIDPHLHEEARKADSQDRAARKATEPDRVSATAKVTPTTVGAKGSKQSKISAGVDEAKGVASNTVQDMKQNLHQHAKDGKEAGKKTVDKVKETAHKAKDTLGVKQHGEGDRPLGAQTAPPSKLEAVRSAADRVGARVKAGVEDAKEAAQLTYKDVVAGAAEAEEVAKNTVSDMKGNLRQHAKDGKEAVEDTADKAKEAVKVTADKAKESMGIQHQSLQSKAIDAAPLKKDQATRSAERVKDKINAGVEEAKEAVQQTYKDVVAGAAEAEEVAKNTVSDMKGNLRQHAKDGKEAVKETADKAKGAAIRAKDSLGVKHHGQRDESLDEVPSPARRDRATRTVERVKDKVKTKVGAGLEEAKETAQLTYKDVVAGAAEAEEVAKNTVSDMQQNLHQHAKDGKEAAKKTADKARESMGVSLDDPAAQGMLKYDILPRKNARRGEAQEGSAVVDEAKEALGLSQDTAQDATQDVTRKRRRHLPQERRPTPPATPPQDAFEDTAGRLTQEDLSAGDATAFPLMGSADSADTHKTEQSVLSLVGQALSKGVEIVQETAHWVHEATLQAFDNVGTDSDEEAGTPIAPGGLGLSGVDGGEIGAEALRRGRMLGGDDNIDFADDSSLDSLDAMERSLSHDHGEAVARSVAVGAGAPSGPGAMDYTGAVGKASALDNVENLEFGKAAKAGMRHRQVEP